MARAIFVCSAGILSGGALRGWLEAGNEVAEIWSGPGNSVGSRRRVEDVLLPGWSTAMIARRHGIPLRLVPRIRGWAEAPAIVAASGADTLLSCVTMQILPQSFLDLFGARAVNFHPALLPFYRGPSPFLGTLLDDRDDCAGATLHVMTAGIDEGPIIAQQAVPFAAAGRNYQVWLAHHAEAFRRLARGALPKYLAGEVEAAPQGEGSYRRIEAEATIGGHLPAAEVERILARAGRSRRIVVKVVGRRRPVSIKRVLARLGPPNGETVRLTPLTLTLDVADARLRLARTTGLDRNIDRLVLAWALSRLG